MDKVIGARDVVSGEVSWHAAAGLADDYDTLCSVSLSDPAFDAVAPPKEQKINCTMCKRMFEAAKKFKPSDFEV